MTKYLISFPAAAMQVRAEEMEAVSADSHAVIEEAKAAGVYVFGGGINEGIEPVLVADNGTVYPDIYPGSVLTGGLLVLELPDRSAAEQWAQKVAAACRCSQELREFGYDAAS